MIFIAKHSCLSIDTYSAKDDVHTVNRGVDGVHRIIRTVIIL